MKGSFFFIAISTILTIVNPVGAIAPFLAMTATDSKEKRRAIARKAALVCGGILAACALAGAYIFRTLGITLPALKVAGGILLLLISIDMLNANQSRSKSTAEEEEEGVHKDDVAVFPLAIPLLSGPGAIVSVFMLSDQATSTFRQISLYGSIAVTSLTVFLVLREAHHLQSVLGKTGMNIISRLMGLILAATAAQFVLDGLVAAFPILAGATK